MSSWSSGSSRTSITSGGRPRPTSNLLSELTAAGYKIDSTTGSIRTISSENSSPPQTPDQMSPDLVSPRTHMSTVLEKRAAGGSDGSGDRSDDSQNHVSGSGGKSSGGEDPSEGVDSSSGGGESTGGDGSSSVGLVIVMPYYPIPFVQPKPTLDDPFYIMGGALPQGHLLRNYPESAPPRETVESKVEAQIVKIEFLKGQPLTEAEKNKLRQSIIGTYGEAWLNDGAYIILFLLLSPFSSASSSSSSSFFLIFFPSQLLEAIKNPDSNPAPYSMGSDETKCRLIRKQHTTNTKISPSHGISSRSCTTPIKSSGRSSTGGERNRRAC